MSRISRGRDRGPLQGLPRHGRRRRQDLPDAAGGPGRGGGGPRRRDRLPRAARPRRDRRPGRRPRGRAAPARHLPRRRRSRRWTCRRSCARAPELCLIDELAHTNAPGRRARASATRTSRDVLDAGIDVFSTVNVQHLESLNDQVAELTGVRVRETVPDRVLGERRRGRAHRPHAGGADRAPARRQGLPAASASRRRSNNFFRIENLAALREVALRQVAEEVEAKRLVAREPLGTRDDERLLDERAAGGRRAAAGAGRAARRARSGSSAAPGARPSGSAPSSTCSGCSRRASRSTSERERQLDGAAPARLGARRAPADRGARRRRRGRRATSSRERGTHLHADGRAAAARAGSRRLREPLPQRLMRAAARRRRADRRRPRPQRRRTESIEHCRDRSPSLLGLRRPASVAGSRWPPAARRRARRRAAGAPDPAARSPGTAISRRALDAALRLRPRRGRDADARLPGDGADAAAARARASAPVRAKAMPLLEAIEQRATRAGRPVDARIERGRTYRHALRGCSTTSASTASSCSATATRAPASPATTCVWLLEQAPAEVLILRPAPGGHAADHGRRGGRALLVTGRRRGRLARDPVEARRLHDELVVALRRQRPGERVLPRNMLPLHARTATPARSSVTRMVPRLFRTKPAMIRLPLAWTFVVIELTWTGSVS